MKKKMFLLIVFGLLFFSCKSHLPFTSKKDKKETLLLVKNNLELTTNNFNKIKEKDSIVFEIAKSIKDTIDTKLIKRRLDSFLLNNYTRKQLLIALEIDRRTTKGYSSPWIFEFVTQEEGKEFPKLDLKNLKDFEKELKTFDDKEGKSRNNNIITVKKDSLNKKH